MGIRMGRNRDRSGRKANFTTAECLLKGGSNVYPTSPTRADEALAFS